MQKASRDLNKGMVKQPNPLFNPESTYYYALNAMLGSREGDTGSLTNEEGNKICVQLPSLSSVLIGHVLLDNNKSILFVVDDNYSYIIEFDPDTCMLNTLIKSGCLNFKSYKQIDALYRMVRGCERTIYFTDGYNPYRSINLEDLKEYLNPGFATPQDANLDPDNGWNCLLFDHFTSHNIPCIELDSIFDSNGTLKPGVVQFAIRYLDSNDNPTRWIYISNPIPLYKEPTSSLPDLADGDEPYSEIELNYINKSIILNIINLDSKFKYYQLAAIESNQGLGTVTDVYILDKQTINPSGINEYIYSGFNPSLYTLTTIDEITTNNIFINTVEAHNQVDDRLILANIKVFTEDWASLQRAVLRTDVKWQTQEYDINLIESNPDIDGPFSGGNTKNPRYHFETMSYMRDEIYALGIVFVFENGVESPAFHIPGRAADIYYDRDYNNGFFNIQSGDDITDDIVALLDSTVVVNQNTHYRDGGITSPGGSGVSGAWDTQLLTVVPDGSMITSDAYTKVESSNVAHIPVSEFSGSCSGCALTKTNNVVISLDNSSPDPDSLIVTLTPTGFVNWRAIVRFSASERSSINSVPIDMLQDLLIEFDSVINNNIIVNVPSYNTKNMVYSISVSLYDEDSTCAAPMSSNSTNLLYYDSGSSYAGTLPIYFTDYETQEHVGCTIPRWKVYNTAINIQATDLDIPGSANNSVGLMGYHEINQIYPELKDCNGLSVWDATSIGGFDLSSSKIRHHRFPDVNLGGQNLIHAVTTHRPSLISVRFDLTDVYANIPADIESKIIGHYIVRAKRDEINKTVLDKGFTFNSEGNILTLMTTGIPSTTGNLEESFLSAGLPAYSRTLEYISNEMLYNNRLIKGTYIKYEACTESMSIRWGSSWDNNQKYSYIARVDFNNYNESDKVRDCRFGVHRPILNSLIVPFDSTGTSPITQTTFNTNKYPGKAGFYELKLPFLYSYKVCSFGGVAASAYEELSHLMDIPGGFIQHDAFLNEVKTRLNYVAIKVYKDVYESLEVLNYIRTHNCMIDKSTSIFNIYGGDIFITESRVVKGWGDRYGSGDDFSSGGSIARLYSESEINSALRYSDDWNSKYWPKDFNNYALVFPYVPNSPAYYLSFLGFTLDNGYIGEYEDNGGDLDDIATFQRPFEYKYNPDYSKLNTDKVYFPLGNDFDYCDDCDGKEQYSIYYSEKANITDIQDNYKVILPANFKIMPGESGIITNLFVEQDQLYCHTERALWALQTRPQQLDTNENTLFIGTGEFLSIPPKRLISTRYGYAGSTDKFATISTQFGTFFIDNEVGQIFQFSGQLKEISQVGMEQWFRRYLPLMFTKQYKELTGLEYLIKHTADKNAVGYQTVFDPRYKRIIIHKKDYLIIDPDKFTSIGFEQELPDPEQFNLYSELQDPETDPEYIRWYYYNEDENEWRETNLNNPDYFINESFTVSFSCEINTWLSFHSYQPNFMFNNRNKYYTYINNLTRDVWAHDKRNYQTYYGVKYDHIVEVTFNPEPSQEKIFESVQFISNVYNYSLTDNRFINLENITFDRFEISNNSQSSNTRDLIVKVGAYDKLSLLPTETLVDRTDNYWRFNTFRDMAFNRTTETLYTTNWIYLNSYFDSLGQGYVDAVVNPLSINLNKPYYEQARFRDKVAFLRLFFNPENDYKISTEVISMLIKPSLR